MNEHVKELVEQTYLFDTYEMVKGEQTKVYGFTSPGVSDLADMIVEKCCEVIAAGKVGYDQAPAEVALDLTAKNVKAYFGVK